MVCFFGISVKLHFRNLRPFVGTERYMTMRKQTLQSAGINDEGRSASGISLVKFVTGNEHPSAPRSEQKTLPTSRRNQIH